MLRLIAGLETPTSGRMTIGGADVTDVPPQQRDLAMVFQSYALYPHKTVRENLAFGLQMRGHRPAAIAERVAGAAASLDLEPLLDRRPAQLSGGQRQRVALGRAIVREPRAFLLDEPLSNLDPLLRVATRAELALLHRRLGATMVYVTHDQEEAMTLGTRIAVMADGAIEQVAAPLEVFERPATVFVARFVGSPAMNVWTGRVSRQGGAEVTTPAFVLALTPDALGRAADGADVTLGIRPHDIRLTALDGADAQAAVESSSRWAPRHDARAPGAADRRAGAGAGGDGGRAPNRQHRGPALRARPRAPLRPGDRPPPGVTAAASTSAPLANRGWRAEKPSAPDRAARGTDHPVVS